MIDLAYVTGAPLFWLAMGMTSATGVFIGAIIYNGDIPMFKKGLVTVLCYTFFLLLTTTTRVASGRTVETIFSHPNATAGIITIVFITFFYLLGMCIGVFTVNKVLKGKHDSR